MSKKSEHPVYVDPTKDPKVGLAKDAVRQLREAEYLLKHNPSEESFGEFKIEYENVQRLLTGTAEGSVTGEKVSYLDGVRHSTVAVGVDINTMSEQRWEKESKGYVPTTMPGATTRATIPTVAEVKAGKPITEEHINALFDNIKIENLEILTGKAFFAKSWNKFVAGEKLTGEDMYHNGGGGVVGHHYREFMNAYAESKTPQNPEGDKKLLQYAIWEVQQGSNKDAARTGYLPGTQKDEAYPMRNKAWMYDPVKRTHSPGYGLQVRREMEVALLDPDHLGPLEPPYHEQARKTAEAKRKAATQPTTTKTPAVSIAPETVESIREQFARGWEQQPNQKPTTGTGKLPDGKGWGLA